MPRGIPYTVGEVQEYLKGAKSTDLVEVLQLRDYVRFLLGRLEPEKLTEEDELVAQKELERPEVQEILARVADGKPIAMIASPECLTNMERGDKKPDFTVTKVKLREAWGTDGALGEDGSRGFTLNWETKSAGFGELDIWVDSEGNLKCDTESMSKRFIKEVFEKLVEQLPKSGS